MLFFNVAAVVVGSSLVLPSAFPQRFSLPPPHVGRSSPICRTASQCSRRLRCLL